MIHTYTLSRDKVAKFSQSTTTIIVRTMAGIQFPDQLLDFLRCPIRDIVVHPDLSGSPSVSQTLMQFDLSEREGTNQLVVVVVVVVDAVDIRYVLLVPPSTIDHCGGHRVLPHLGPVILPL